MELSSSALPWLVPSVVAGIAAIGLLIKVSRWSGHVDGDLARLSDVLEGVRDDVRSIRSELSGLVRRFPPTPVAGDSPLRLTDFGEKIAQCLAADAWATERAAVAASEVTGLQPFEVDAWCQKYVADDRDERMRREIARCAYEFGIEHDGVRQVLRVVLRDALLGAAAPEMAQGTSGE